MKPCHPVTGETATYYWERQGPRGENVREPRWDSNRRTLAAAVKAMAAAPEVTWLSTAEVAALTGKKPAAVRRWIALGRLKAVPADPGGTKPHLLINGADLVEFTRREPRVVTRTAAVAP